FESRQRAWATREVCISFSGAQSDRRVAEGNPEGAGIEWRTVETGLQNAQAPAIGTASARLDNWPHQVLRLVVKYQQNPLRAARDPRAAPGGRQTTRGRIYLLGDDGRPVAYGVRLGIGDGLWTELVVAPGSAEAGVLKEGAKVIVGVDAPEASRRPRSPF
ncbi:MAG TPA: hypothetical protein PLG77_15935, partial [Burkholderiaceae bacterium]|nr:hypothetical protein [Burkholderiaceae bacterium]